MHPSISENNAWSKPDPDSPHPAWLYANTYADMNHLKAYIDVAMEAAGIPKMPGWKIAELKSIRQQVKDQMPDQLQQDWVEGNLFSTDTEESNAAEEDEEDVEDEEEDTPVEEEEEDIEDVEEEEEKEYADDV
jgi:hypothetical protein